MKLIGLIDAHFFFLMIILLLWLTDCKRRRDVASFEYGIGERVLLQSVGRGVVHAVQSAPGPHLALPCQRRQRRHRCRPARARIHQIPPQEPKRVVSAFVCPFICAAVNPQWVQSHLLIHFAFQTNRLSVSYGEIRTSSESQP